MRVKDIVEKLDLKVYSGSGGLDREVKSGYVSDLLSDVMGNANAGNIWVTLQTHKNIMAIASLKELAAVILVKGLKPDEATMEKSNEEDIPVLGTDEETYPLTGKLYEMMKS